MLTLIRVGVVFENDIYMKDYTSKLVKSLLIAGNPRLVDIFERHHGVPKPIHITPLFTEVVEGGRRKKRAVYSGYVSPSDIAKLEDVSRRIKPVMIRSGVEYIFYVGTTQELFPEVVAALGSVDKFVFGAMQVSVAKLSYEVEYVDLGDEAEKIAGKLASSNTIKVVFESPAMLKDPLAIRREKKKKVLLPLPEAIFSTPVYMVLVNEGKARRSIYVKTMIYTRSVLDTPYTAIKTVNITWLVYRDKLIPGLIGYAKFFIDKEVLSYAQRKMEKYNIDYTKTLAKSIAISRVLGVGTGRATGFGHVSILPL